MKQPVSPIFHGSDIFAPAAAHLSRGVSLGKFGKALKFGDLVKAPYKEAVVKGNTIEAKVIHINKYGSIHLNILHSAWDKFAKKKEIVTLTTYGRRMDIKFVETFGDVDKDKPLILKDDYGRVEVAINMGNLSKTYDIRVGDECIIQKMKK